MTFPRAASALVLLSLIALAPQSSPAQETERPLVLEDVVRLYVSGTPAEELIDRIHRSQVDFDVSDEMLQELRLAGLPDKLIQAMVERQRELHPPAVQFPEEAPVAPEPSAPPGLTLHLKVKGAKASNRTEGETLPQSIRVVDTVRPELLAQLRIREEDAKITEIAIYVACLSATHVPDHWRSHTPLGRDFISVQRHKMLTFLTGVSREADGSGILSLEIPTEIRVDLDPEDKHDLAVGFAVQIAGRFYDVTSILWEDLLPANQAGPTKVELHQPKDLSPWSLELTKSLNP